MGETYKSCIQAFIPESQAQEVESLKAHINTILNNFKRIHINIFKEIEKKHNELKPRLHKQSLSLTEDKIKLDLLLNITTRLVESSRKANLLSEINKDLENLQLFQNPDKQNDEEEDEEDEDDADEGTLAKAIQLSVDLYNSNENEVESEQTKNDITSDPLLRSSELTADITFELTKPSLFKERRQNKQNNTNDDEKKASQATKGFSEKESQQLPTQTVDSTNTSTVNSNIAPAYRFLNSHRNSQTTPPESAAESLHQEPP